VTILYFSDDPEKFIIEKEVKSNYISLSIFVLIGLIIFIIGIFALAGYIKL